jgi:hypothetical protein
MSVELERRRHLSRCMWSSIEENFDDPDVVVMGGRRHRRAAHPHAAGARARPGRAGRPTLSSRVRRRMCIRLVRF